jgi:2'-5' RNA ligase
MPELAQPTHLRLFVAVSLPQEVKARILEAQDALRAAVSQGQIRWTKLEQFHLTLRFLGRVDSARLDALKQSLLAVCGRFSPMPLRSSRIGFFPGPRSPRVVWAGVLDSSESLAVLQEAVQAGTAAFTSEPPEGSFAGHVTLARIKALHRPETDGLTAAAASLSNRMFGEWTATEIHLMRSELNPKGAQYTVAGSFPLSAPPATST